jgi:hypothetical protein
VRVPRVLTKCKVAVLAAVILMSAGTWYGPPELRAWGLLFGVLAAGLCITAAVRDGVESIKEHIRKWTFETFREGVEAGREMEAAERLIASSRE